MGRLLSRCVDHVTGVLTLARDWDWRVGLTGKPL